jgi:hypothetical protein
LWSAKPEGLAYFRSVSFPGGLKTRVVKLKQYRELGKVLTEAAIKN